MATPDFSIHVKKGANGSRHFWLGLVKSSPSAAFLKLIFKYWIRIQQPVTGRSRRVLGALDSCHSGSNSIAPIGRLTLCVAGRVSPGAPRRLRNYPHIAVLPLNR